jgi:hypothetical protein
VLALCSLEVAIIEANTWRLGAGSRSAEQLLSVLALCSLNIVYHPASALFNPTNELNETYPSIEMQSVCLQAAI